MTHQDLKDLIGKYFKHPFTFKKNGEFRMLLNADCYKIEISTPCRESTNHFLCVRVLSERTPPCLSNGKLVVIKKSIKKELIQVIKDLNSYYEKENQKNS